MSFRGEKVMKSVFCERICSTVAIAILLFSATFAFSQGIVTGSVSGVVEDQQGAVVPNANVTVIQLATNRVFRTQTTSAGIISLRDLPMGAYNPEDPRSARSDSGRCDPRQLPEHELQQQRWPDVCGQHQHGRHRPAPSAIRNETDLLIT